MPKFRYKAADKTGRHMRGRLDASNEADLELRLKRMGLDLISFRVVAQSASLFGRGAIKRRDLITFCFNLEQVARAGVPLLDGLRDMRDNIENQRFRDVITSLLEDMEGGKLLSQCLAVHPAVFNAVFVSLVKAGEQTDRLAEVFENLGATLKWQDELVAQTRRLAAYPLLVLVVVSAVAMFLLLYLVPQMVALLKSMGVELPPQTRMLIFLSGVVSAYWPLLLGLPFAALAAAAVLVRRSYRARYWWDYLKLHLPVTGEIMQKIIFARFANFFALMYQSGVTILDAIKTSEEIVANRVIAEGMQRAGQQISSGESLSETFRNLGFFPPLVIRLLRTGETTGALDHALLNIGYFYARDVKEAMERALKLLEPVLTLFLGVILGLIMFSVLTPVYDVLGKLKF